MRANSEFRPPPADRHVVVDLFAGAGGLSLGFERAGFTVALAVESDASAASTYEANHPDTLVLKEVIERGWSVRKRLSDELPETRIDVLIGGPPCQGWSSLGHRAEPKSRHRLNGCVDLFVDQAEELLPSAVVMENVHGFARKEGGAHLRRIAARLQDAGYEVWTHDVRAAEFGVPQLRRRVFVVGILKKLDPSFSLRRTHAESRWRTVWEAIGDLPSVASGCRAERYVLPPVNSLQRELRRGAKQLTLQEAPKHSGRMLDILSALDVEGASRRDLDSVELTSGFHNTYCRLWSDRPAPAITSSAGRISSGRHAHPFDDRALTPREAARLQTFPDSYVWSGDRWDIYRQIGNAVPPRLARAVAKALQRAMKSDKHPTASESREPVHRVVVRDAIDRRERVALSQAQPVRTS